MRVNVGGKSFEIGTARSSVVDTVPKLGNTPWVVTGLSVLSVILFYPDLVKDAASFLADSINI